MAPLFDCSSIPIQASQSGPDSSTHRPHAEAPKSRERAKHSKRGNVHEEPASFNVRITLSFCLISRLTDPQDASIKTITIDFPSSLISRIVYFFSCSTTYIYPSSLHHILGYLPILHVSAINFLFHTPVSWFERAMAITSGKQGRALAI
jgi:hypothetical protein